MEKQSAYGSLKGQGVKNQGETSSAWSPKLQIVPEKRL